MAASIEILVNGRAELAVEVGPLPFALVVSSPPRSHRGKGSLWQSEFDRIGGTLFHVGDPGLSLLTRRFWAYEILEDIELRRYRFLPPYRAAFFALLETLLRDAPDGEVIVTSDNQLGPKPEKFKKIYRVDKVIQIHDTIGLRLNSLMRVKP